MNYFYIDTSSNYLYSGILSNGVLKAFIKKNLGKDMSKYSLYEIQKMFEKIAMKPNEIDKIIVVSGPGSFTGIRIGMTFAKTFALTLKKEIISITSLEAMAYSINTSKYKVPVIDARRGYVYSGVYDESNILLENQYISLQELKKYLDSLKKEYVFITNDSKLELSDSISYDPDISKIINKVKDRASTNPHFVNPVYLKLTEAEENLGSINYDNRITE